MDNHIIYTVAMVGDKTSMCNKCFQTILKHPMCLLILWLVCMIVMSVVISENYSNLEGSHGC